MPNQTEMETRSLFEASELRLETREHKMPKIIGLASVFNDLGQPIIGFPEFKEKVLPGAFKKTLARGDEVVALFDHDFGQVIGRRSAGTLKMEETSRGLRVSIDPPDTTLARDLITNIKAGNLKGMSIGFTIPNGGSRFIIEDETELREISEIDLFEVSVVAMPVFDATTVNLNAKKGFEDDVRRWRHERQKEYIATLQSKGGEV